MSNELVQINNNTDMVLGDGVDLTGMSDVRITPSNIILIQPTTQDPGNARPGQFLDALSGEVFDEMVMVPLRITRPRVKYPAGAEFGVDPECRSDDGVVPAKSAKAPQSTLCRTCRHAQWWDGKRPACKESIRLLMVTKDGGLPRRFQASGMGIRPTAELLACIKQDMKSSGYQLYDYYFKLSSHKAVSKQGVFYTPRYSELRKVPTKGEFLPAFTEFVVSYLMAANETDAVYADEAVTDQVANVVDAEIVEV